MSAPTENLWLAQVKANPEHTTNYVRRWRELAASGQDVFGEARMIDAMAERESRILDAGCGTGRIGGWLSEHGHHVQGVDLDEQLIAVARQDYPAVAWSVGNLAALDLRTETGERHEFDLIVSAGNVLTFLSGAERLPALTRLAEHLAPGGRLVVGFGAGRGYDFEDFAADAASCGLAMTQRYSSWHLHEPAADFLVAVLRAEGRSAA